MDGEVCPIHRVNTFLSAESEDSGLRPGLVVGGRYEVVTLLGKGAMGAVYVARQMSVDREVALKIMGEAAIKDGNESIQRFYREARNASRLADPHIVKIHDFGVDEALRLPFIVMEMVEGETLGAVLRERGALPLGEACTIMAQVARALAAAHELGIIHRDLKPENIMVREMPGQELHATVLDFGIAKRFSGDAEGIDDVTATGAIVGTPRYMSPEQVSGDALSPQSDLYALGCIFYELVEGKAPFISDPNSNVMLKHVNAEPPPLAPAGFEDSDAGSLYADLMAKLPTDRPKTAAMVAARFKALAIEAGGNVSASHGSLARVVDSETQIPGHRRRPEPTEADPAPQRSAWLGAAAVLFVLLLLGIGIGTGTGLLPKQGETSGPDRALVPTPLGAADATLACPVWRAEGVDEPSGWLGAAAADAFCRRAQWSMGGRASRVLKPAALAGMPPFFENDASLDPFAEAELHPRSMAAARSQATAWTKGVIRYEPATQDFTVSVELHSSEGLIGGPFEGRGRAPFEASFDALSQAEAQGALPAQAIDPVIAKWWYLDSRDEALKALEHGYRLMTGLDAQSSCQSVFEDGLPSPAVYSNMDGCDETLTQRAANDPRLKEDTPRALTWRIIGRAERDLELGEGTSERLRAQKASLDAAAERNEDPEVRFLLDLARGFLLFRLESPLAPAFTRKGLTTRPGEFLDARQTYAYRASLQTQGYVAARHAWNPHDIEYGRRVPAEQRMRFLERAYVLFGGSRSEFDVVAYKYGHGLVQEGSLDRARTLATQLLAGHANHLRTTILLEAEVGLFEGRFTHVVDVLSSSPKVRDHVPVVRHLLTLAALSPDLAPRIDEALGAFCSSQVDEKPGFNASLLLLEVAGHRKGTLGQRCLQVFDRWQAELEHSGFFALCREGLTPWMKGDAVEAVKAWRRIRPPLWGCRMPIQAFDRIDAPLASKLDAGHLADGTYGGAHPAQVREAHRAAERGDWDAATRLAKRVMEAWSTADVGLPAVAEMQALLKRKPRGLN
ncbi:MAG: serine/threonine-protein kinase [Myxococcota bacterium]